MSRNERVTGYWKIVYLTSTYGYKNKKHETSFDGLIKKAVITVYNTITYGISTCFIY
jgi:hypothetical protein